MDSPQFFMNMKGEFYMPITEAWDLLVESGLVSNETLEIITSINGYSEDTLNDVLYVTTGYRNFDQWLEDF